MFVLKDECIGLPHRDSNRPESAGFEGILVVAASVLKQKSNLEISCFVKYFMYM
jgi:hypothetical protein